MELNLLPFAVLITYLEVERRRKTSSHDMVAVDIKRTYWLRLWNAVTLPFYEEARRNKFDVNAHISRFCKNSAFQVYQFPPAVVVGLSDYKTEAFPFELVVQQGPN